MEENVSWGGKPLFPKGDKHDVTHIAFDPVMDHIEKTGRVKIDSLATERVYHTFNAWEDNIPVDQPPDSCMKMIAGVDPSGTLHSQIHVSWLYYFVPDGYWPPINTIFEHCRHSLERSECRREHDYHAKVIRFFVILAIVGIFWVVYGADKVLG